MSKSKVLYVFNKNIELGMQIDQEYKQTVEDVLGRVEGALSRMFYGSTLKSGVYHNTVMFEIEHLQLNLDQMTSLLEFNVNSLQQAAREFLELGIINHRVDLQKQKMTTIPTYKFTIK